MTLAELAINHPYYCSDSNYYSTKPGDTFETATDFLDNWENCDIDMNLVFRWDVKPNLDDDENPLGTYYAEVFIMQQRKGIFYPIYIRSISDDEVDRFVIYLKKHQEVLSAIWKPL